MNGLSNRRNTAPAGATGAARPWWTWIGAALALLASAVSGCGGGVGSGGTGTYASGTITGFGSIIVNAVRFDDSAATVLDDDDASRSRSELKLGMTVEIDAGPIGSDDGGRRSTATRIRFGSALLGRVEGVDAAAGQIVVLGQTVTVADDTVFDDSLSAGLGSLASGTLVEIYGQSDAASGRLRATRIEQRSTADRWRIRGLVTALDLAARTLRIGDATLAWGTSVAVPADLGVGRLVRLQLAPSSDLSGRYVILAFDTALRPPPDRDAADLQGLITAFTSTAAFSVNGIAVDASSASFPDGTAGIRLGARVEVQGRSVGGGIVASSVRPRSDADLQDSGFEFKGPVAAVDAARRTVTVRDTVISTARSDLRLDGGTPADLVVGRSVEVRAQRVPGSSRLEATRIVFK